MRERERRKIATKKQFKHIKFMSTHDLQQQQQQKVIKVLNYKSI